MTFSSSIKLKKTEIGGPKYVNRYRRLVRGTFTNTAGSTGGDIHPGLKKIETVLAGGNATSGDVYSAITSSNSGITITTAADVDGWWQVTGFEK